MSRGSGDCGPVGPNLVRYPNAVTTDAAATNPVTTDAAAVTAIVASTARCTRVLCTDRRSVGPPHAGPGDDGAVMVGGEGLAVLEAVRVGGGVMRGTALVARGHTHRTIRALVDENLLIRIRRVWVALPDAEPLAVAAAREGVVVSCVTQARRLGVWVLGNEPPHVAASPHGPSPHVAVGTVVHWAHPVVPRHPDVLFDEVENVLALAIACQPEEHARAIVESALRQRVIDRSAALRLPFDATALAMIESASPWSDSGLETFFLGRLRWLRLPITVQVWIAGHRVDVLIGERLVVQIDGGHHVGAQRDADIAHDAALMLMGYHVIRVSYTQIVHRWHEVQDRVMRAVAQGLHLAR